MPSTYIWPSEDGWPYPDDATPGGDPALVFDDLVDADALLIEARGSALLEGLTDLERTVVTAHYGLDGSEPRSVKDLHVELDLTRAQVRDALVSALEKLRLVLGAQAG